MYKLAEPQHPIKNVIIALYVFVCTQLLLLVGVHSVTNIPFANFTADPAATYNYSPIFGYISNLGIILWCACASVCFLSAVILNIRRDQRNNVFFFVNFGVLTSLLMLDDLFMFHESIAPWYLNISEKAVLGFYGLYTLGCFYHFRRNVRESDWKLLAIAAVTFAMSIVIDQVSERYYISGEYLFEDGLKFIGIASWLAYFLKHSFDQITNIVMPSYLSDQLTIKRPKVDVSQFRNN